MTNVIRLAALLVGSSILSISIPQAASAGKADDTLVVAMDDRIRAVDTIGETQLNLRMLGMLIDEQLFVYNPETKQNEYALAKSHNFVDDVTMDVELRENVKFHDGTVLSADDVVYTFDILLSSKSTAQYQRLSPWLDRVEKTGPMSVRFHLKQPYPFVTFDLASHAPIKKVGDIVVDGIADYENGLGPYTVVDFTPDEVVLERFEDYYEAGLKPAEIGKIRIRAIPDWGTQQAEIATGGVDLMWEIPNDIARNYDNHATIEHVSAPSLAWYFVMLNPEAESPLKDVRVRRAIYHAIDRQKILDNLVDDGSEVLKSACSHFVVNCEQDVTTYEHDPEKAKALLAEAGHGDGFDLTWWVSRELPINEAIASDLAAVGITLDIRNVSSGSLEEARRSGEALAYWNHWGNAGNPDVYAKIRTFFHSQAPRSLVKDPELDKLIDAGAAASSLEERKESFSKALRHIADNAYVVPFYTSINHGLKRAELDFTPPTDGNVVRLYLTRWN